MKEVKLMTQQGVGLLPSVGALGGHSPLVAPKLDGDGAALESQISLLTKRIESIANHLQVNNVYSEFALVCCLVYDLLQLWCAYDMMLL